MSAPKRRAPRSRASERGVALIIVVVAIAILTAVAADFAYNSRVDLQLAANQRDELRAQYLAKSGISLSRLLLRFQKQVDQIKLPNLSGLLGPGAPPIPGLPQGQLSLQLWKLARVDCYMLQGLVSSDGAEGEREDRTGFEAEPLDEATKGTELQKKTFGGFRGLLPRADLRRGGEAEPQRAQPAPGDRPVLRGPRALALRRQALRVPLRGGGLEPGAHHRRRSCSSRSATGSTTTSCSRRLNTSGQGTDLFLKGFSDENSNYDRYTPRYKAKNAFFDSLDELYMVHGVNDRFMAAFRDRLTVYPPSNAALNINTDDPMMLWVAVLSVLPKQTLASDVRLQNPVFQEEVIKRIRAARLMPGMGMSASTFIAIVESTGLTVAAEVKAKANQKNDYLSDKSNTFKIVSTGEAGQVQRTIEAVVQLDDGLGKLVYWRED